MAKITTAMTKASGKIFDIREKDGTLSGGKLKLNKKQRLIVTGATTNWYSVEL